MNRFMKKILSFLVLICLLVLSACSAPRSGILATANPGITSDSGTQTSFPTDARQNKVLIIFAASSLTDAFQDLVKTYESTHPGTKISLSFAGSQILRTQLEQGAVADIFASADHKNMEILVRDNIAASNPYQVFATNRLIVILPSGNPAGVITLHDLARPGVKLILADPSVPAGNYARQILANISSDPAYGSGFSTAVLANVVSNETDVRQVVTKVELGEADAGIVYVSDAFTSPDMETIPIPDKFNIIAQYPIAILANSPNPGLAGGFIEFIMSPEGQAIMEKWGFTPGK
jgi:molybdate transport system substrate-binding protein